MKSPGIPTNVNGPLPRKYREWIRRFVDGDGECLCAEYSHLMKKHYPELIIMDGEYYFCTHAWCETPNGLIVDPTIAQFTTSPHPENYHGTPRREVLSQCPHCGGPLYVDWIKRCTPFCHGHGFKIGDIVVVVGDNDEAEVVARRQTYSRTKKTVVDLVTVKKGSRKMYLDISQLQIHRIRTGGSHHERALQDLYRPVL